MNLIKYKILLICIFVCLGIIGNSQILLDNTADLNNIKVENAIQRMIDADRHAQKVAERDKAVKIDSKNIENFYKVSPVLYRGAQPTEAGIKELAELGVKTIVNLRLNISNEGDLAGKYGVNYYHIPMSPTSINDGYVQKFLDILSDPSNQPVFLHCQYGSDRTGAMVGVYRIAFEGWPNNYAVKEMTKGGFKFSPIFANLAHYVEKFDIKRFNLIGLLRLKYPVQLKSSDSSYYSYSY